MNEIRRRRPALPVVLLTAWGSIALAVEGMRAGAADFVTKPWENQRLLESIRTTLSLVGARSAEDADRESLDENHDFSEILGTDPAIVRVLNQLVRVAKTDATVLIQGESGTGKELLANAIHLNSARAAGPLVKVNMGAIVPGLFESEMFGHVRGAFTDAKRDRVGYFEQAHGGTIFLDEITELDRPSQVKLLRVLQDQTFQRVGSSELRRSSFRVVAATNRDLKALVASGQFREDLYYRLNLITLTLPPLRKRRSDIPLIAAHHLRQVRERYGLGDVAFSADVFAWLAAQPWGGNVRELRHCVERVALVAGKPLLTRADFEARTVQPDLPIRRVVARARPRQRRAHTRADRADDDRACAGAVGTQHYASRGAAGSEPLRAVSTAGQTRVDRRVRLKTRVLIHLGVDPRRHRGRSVLAARGSRVVAVRAGDGARGLVRVRVGVDPRGLHAE